MISTHDLELTRLADMNGNIRNAHFQESVEEGTLHFDYLLRPGPCPTTNALRIMAQEGLPVPESSEKGEGRREKVKNRDEGNSRSGLL